MPKYEIITDEVIHVRNVYHIFAPNAEVAKDNIFWGEEAEWIDSRGDGGSEIVGFVSVEELDG